jgi:hypothetical protein
MRHYWRLALLLASMAFSAQGAVQLAAHKIAKDITGAEVYSLASGGYNSTAGNLILIWAVSFSGSQPVGTITDSAGDTFQPLALNKGTWFGQWFYAKDVKGDGYNVITIRPATTGRATFTYPAMIVMELSGADKSNPVVEVSGPQGALAEWTSKPFDAPAGSAAFLGIVTANGGAYTAGDGFKIGDSYLTPNSSKFSVATLDQYFAEAKSGATAGVKWTGTLQASGAVVVVKP